MNFGSHSRRYREYEGAASAPARGALSMVLGQFEIRRDAGEFPYLLCKSGRLMPRASELAVIQRTAFRMGAEGEWALVTGVAEGRAS